MCERAVFLGVDLGSVSTNLVLLDPYTDEVVVKLYLRTNGAPIQALVKGMKQLADRGPWEVLGVGTTGSGRQLAAAILGADVVKNEITAHAVAAIKHNPATSTVIEIGGQDSKIILIRNGVVHDFAMNTICAAGTGAFLDQQAARLGIAIEEFGNLALQSQHAVRIAGRCTVFAESDMIHKQQLGHGVADILAGLCQAMVRNYLSNVAKGKRIAPVVLFQGGVAANTGIRKALESALGMEVEVPDHYDVMGAVGAAVLAKERWTGASRTRFAGFAIGDSSFASTSWECSDCPNHCEIVQIARDGTPLACWGSRCGKHQLAGVENGSA
ncbi:MAG TPA: 2-hydroxyglutaryl-CoA dehydratase [Firmicutes bacterium]|jgi:predicted CoA-substrate-specific enzyme activase|nr:MAG: 2-hydroxyglutaryl-CoA dehydratase [Peptococcaceae bacterium 1109]HHT72603.1 2-hydroxyglutaryl-CoA dehydratase [Bacillota bacterium]